MTSLGYIYRVVKEKSDFGKILKSHEIRQKSSFQAFISFLTHPDYIE